MKGGLLVALSKKMGGEKEVPAEDASGDSESSEAAATDAWKAFVANPSYQTYSDAMALQGKCGSDE